MSTSAIPSPSGVQQAQATTETHSAHATSPATKSTPPAPERQAGVLGGLKSRAAALGRSVANAKMLNVSTDMNALSVFRITHKGRPILPHNKNDATRKVAMPLADLAADEDVEALTRRPPSSAMRKPERNVQRALGGFGKAAAATTTPTQTHVFDLSAAARQCFAGACEAEIAPLVADLNQALAKGPAQSDPVRAAQGELLLDALAQTSAGMPAKARRVLQRMQEGLHFEPQKAPTGLPMDDHLTALAWRTAQHLSPTANGYACARALAGESWPDPSEGPARYAPQVWLRAANELAKASGYEADPAGVARTAAELGSDVSATPQAHAAWIASAAARLWEAGSAEGLSESEKGALLAGRQGFFADGPGTPFAAARSRMARFLNHTIPRATSDSPELQPGADEAAVPVASQRKMHAALARAFGYQKTAVAGMRKGVEGASLGAWDKDEASLNDATRGAFVALARCRDQRASAEPRTKQRSALLHKDSRALHQVVEQAELDVLADLSRPRAANAAARQAIEYGTKLDDDTLDLIAARVAARLSDEAIGAIARDAAGQPAQDAAAPGNPKPTLREARIRRLLTELRDRMAAGSSDPSMRAGARMRVRKYLSNGSDVVDAAKIEVWRKRFATGLSAEAQKPFDTIDRIALGRAVTPRGTTTEDYRDAGERIIDALEGSGKAIITDGGQYGLSTRGITATAASFPLIAPRLNLQAAHGRQSVLEFSRSTAAYKISFGTQRRQRFNAGGGMQFGHNFGIARVGGNVEGGYEWDDSEQCTVDFSIARRLKDNDDAWDDTAGKRQLKAVNAYLFDNAGRGKSERALWNDLGARFFDSDDLSVSWTRQVGQLRRADGTANVRAGVKIGAGQYAGRVNGIASGVYQYVPRATLDAVDESGQTKIESHRFGSGHRAGVQVGVNATLNDALKKQGALKPTDVASLSIFTPNIYGIEVPFHDSFTQAKVTLVRERGKLQVRASNADIEFASFSQYKDALRQDPTWKLAFGVEPGHPMPATPAQRDAAIAAGSKKIDEYLSVLSANRAQNLKFVLRRRLREHAAVSADALDDRIAALKAKHSDAAEVETLIEQREALLKRTDSWLPTELLTVQASEQQVSMGLRVGLQIATQKGTRGEREVTSLKVKPREADRLDGAWPRHGDQGA